MGALVDPLAAVNSNACGGASASGYAALLPTSGRDRKAEGEAKYRIDGDRQEFEVETDKLKGSGLSVRFTLRDGATFEDTLPSKGEVRYRTDGGDRPLPSELSPVTKIARVEILRGGDVVLSGGFDGNGVLTPPDDDDGGGSGGDDDGGGGGDDDGGGGSGGGDDDGNSGPGGGDDNGGPGGGGDGGGTEQVDEQIALAPSGVDADAAGYSRVRVDGSRQRFKVEAYDLNPSTNYEVWVDGQLVGTLHTNSNGEGELDYDSDHDPLPPAIDPVTDISLVEVRLNSSVVLTGSF
jgi:hypothetical protein